MSQQCKPANVADVLFLSNSAVMILDSNDCYEALKSSLKFPNFLEPFFMLSLMHIKKLLLINNSICGIPFSVCHISIGHSKTSKPIMLAFSYNGRIFL